MRDMRTGGIALLMSKDTEKSILKFSDAKMVIHINIYCYLSIYLITILRGT